MAAVRQQLADATAQVNSMTQLVAYTAMQSEPASDRVRTVLASTNAKDVPAPQISALLNALALDPNVNVRLSALDALYPHSARARGSRRRARRAQPRDLADRAGGDDRLPHGGEGAGGPARLRTTFPGTGNQRDRARGGAARHGRVPLIPPTQSPPLKNMKHNRIIQSVIVAGACSPRPRLHARGDERIRIDDQVQRSVKAGNAANRAHDRGHPRQGRRHGRGYRPRRHADRRRAAAQGRPALHRRRHPHSASHEKDNVDHGRCRGRHGHDEPRPGRLRHHRAEKHQRRAQGRPRRRHGRRAASPATSRSPTRTATSSSRMSRAASRPTR